MNTSTIEEFIGNTPVPVYLGQKYTDKLKLQVTLIKNQCVFHNNIYFNEKECRTILRLMTGIRGYQWLKFTSRILDEDLSYKAKVVNVSYKRIGGHVAGIILNLECDSHFAWSKEINITVKAIADKHFYIFNNTDDLYNYIYPTVSILSSSAGILTITNITDNWTSEIKNIKSDEKITIDAQRQIISSNISHDLLLDDFNLKWPRLVPDKNEYVCNKDITINMKFRVPRKAGIVYEQDESGMNGHTHFASPYQKSRTPTCSCADLTPITAEDIDLLF